MIKTKIIEEPSRIIEMSCPYCNRYISRRVEAKKKKGEDSCKFCHTVFEWEEVDEK